jgi:hypothetical protein
LSSNLGRRSNSLSAYYKLAQGGGRRGAHLCTSVLDPCRVSECEDVQGHDDLKGLNEGLSGNVRKLRDILSDVLGNELKGTVRANVRVR